MATKRTNRSLVEARRRQVEEDLENARALTKSKKGVVLEVLRQLELENGLIEPQDVVDLARNPSHPLHDSFEWNNAEAGERYRLMQARLMINSVKVEFMGEKREAFLNVRTQVQSVPRRGYMSIEKVVSNEDLHNQVIQGAINELEYWQKKYEKLQELKGVVDMDRLQKARKRYLR